MAVTPTGPAAPGGGPTPDELKKQIEELNKKLKEAGGLGIDIADAFKKAGTDTKKLNEYAAQLNKQYEDLTDNADYVYRTFQDISSELKNQNLLLKIGRGAYKAFTDIAQDLNYYQKGTNDLTDKQFKKIKSNLGLEKEELRFAVERLEASKKDRAIQIAQLSAIEARTPAQTARLKELQKENELLFNAKETLKSGIPILEKELSFTKQIADTRKDLGGVAQATGKLLSQFGGSLANFLNISDATEEVEEFNKNLIQGALNNKKVKDQLLEVEKKRHRLELDGQLTDKKRAELDDEAYKIKQAAVASANNLNNKFKSLGVLVQGLGTGLKKSLLDPVTLITFFINQGLTANAQSVQLGKSLGFGADKANAFRENLASIARDSTNINVTTANLVAAFNELEQATGFVANYSKDTLETHIMLTKQFGLTGDEAAGIYNYSVLTGQSASKVNDKMVGAYVAARNSLKVGVPFKAVIAEAAKVSGQLSANFKNNPELITKAIVQAKALGTTLEDAKEQGKQLLNFESSIENELKAELLTGQQMNLERARAAALQGDQVTVMKELANQGMTLEKFSSMNVLAQDAFAQALGTTSDKLTEQLKKQKLAQESGKSLAEITKEEALEAEKRQSVQDKFNAAILKLQDFFGNLLAGPVGQLLEALTNIVGVIVDVLQPVLSVVFTPLIWAGQALGKMSGVLKYIVGLYAVMKGFQLASIGYQRIQLGLSIAQKGENMIAANMGLATIASKRTQVALENQSLITKMAGNTALLFQLIREQGIAGIKAYILGLEEKSVIKQMALFLWKTKTFLVEKGTALFSKIGLTSLLGQIARLPVLLGLKSAEAAIATETAVATTVTAEAASFGTATLWIVAGLAAVAGAMAAYALKDGVVDTEKGPVMSGDFGTVQMDPKDKAMYGADGKIKVGTNLMGGEEGGKGGGGVSIDLTPMIAAINEVRAAVDRLASKDTSVVMDSTKVGTTQMKAATKTA